MKTSKLRGILFGLIAVFAIAVVMTSCEQESLDNDIVTSKQDLLNVNNLLHEHGTHTNCGGECDGKVDYTKEISIKLPYAKNKTNITVDVTDGIAYYQGDIILGKIDDLLEKGVAKDSQHWPNSIIPYEIESDFSSSQTDRINDAIDNVNVNTNLCLVPRTNESDYVEFITSDRCASAVGMKGGRQTIKLKSTCSYGTTIHEILHAAGVYHEQAREDRNDYVEIHEENITPGKEHNFYQQITGASDYGNYDYGSIMHYGTHGFSKNGDPTITTIPPGIPIGQRDELSDGDIFTINTIYPNCNVGGTETFETQISHNNYDAEERASDGDMNLTSSDLEFGKDYNTEQHIGLRFKNISIPQGTQICDAYIEFTAKGTTNSNFTVEITGHDHDDASGFYNDDYNVSDRDRTSADVDWDFGSSTWTTNEVVQSPDVSSIIQEIINRNGWNSGSDMAFVFETKSGNGTRRVYSRDGDKYKSAKLVITYGGC